VDAMYHGTDLFISAVFKNRGLLKT
jgi:hypothetical protein